MFSYFCRNMSSPKSLCDHRESSRTRDTSVHVIFFRFYDYIKSLRKIERCRFGGRRFCSVDFSGQPYSCDNFELTHESMIILKTYVHSYRHTVLLKHGALQIVLNGKTIIFSSKTASVDRISVDALSIILIVDDSNHHTV